MVANGVSLGIQWCCPWGWLSALSMQPCSEHVGAWPCPCQGCQYKPCCSSPSEREPVFLQGLLLLPPLHRGEVGKAWTNSGMLFCMLWSPVAWEKGFGPAVPQGILHIWIWRCPCPPHEVCYGGNVLGFFWNQSRWIQFSWDSVSSNSLSSSCQPWPVFARDPEELAPTYQV